MSLLQHDDPWIYLDNADTVVGKLRLIHQLMLGHLPFISRVAVALYDPATDMLRTFAYSSQIDSPLTHYHARLSECQSLAKVVANRQSRVVNDLSIFNNSHHAHAQLIYAAGYRSSYTVPMIWEGKFFGFVFFNSQLTDVFDERALSELDVIAHMIILLVYNERSNVRTLMATVKSALELTHSRDPETGSHLERMSRYARLIAKVMAKKLGLPDDYVEHVYLFAPLHDLGKLAIPDRILLKAGKLTEEEFSVMKTHSGEGRRLIDKLLENYGLRGISHVDVLRNIARHHHEALDGSGYPDRLAGDNIPLEARIVTVADVFDALTSRRPYKEPWTNEAAFAHLRGLAGIKFDAECVEALVSHAYEVEQIQRAFREDPFGA